MPTRRDEGAPPLRRRSATQGRERWDVPGIFRRPALARALEKAVAGHPAVVEARANPLTGRLLVHYRADCDFACETWIDEGLRQASLEVAAAAPIVLPPRQKANSAALKKVVAGALPEPRYWIVPPLWSLLAKTIDLLQGLSFVATVNTARGDAPSFLARLGFFRPGARMAFMGLLSLGLVVANALIQPLRRKAWTELSQRVEQTLRTRLFAQIQRQDVEFFDRRGTGQLIQLVADDTEKVGDFVGEALDRVIQKGVILAMSGFGLLFTSPLLTFFVCLPVPFFLLPPVLLGRRVKEAYSGLGKSAGRFSQRLEDSLAGIADVKSFTAEGHEIRRIERSGAQVARYAVESETVSTLQAQLTDGIVHLGLYSAAAYAGSLAARDLIPQTSYTSALYLIPRLLSVPAGLDSITGRYHRASHAAERIVEVLEQRPKIRGGRRKLPQPEGAVVFDDVSFAYDPGNPILDGVSFTLEPGSTLAIVGPTGSGKSTLLRLLLRFYDADAGRVLLDGHDVRELDLEHLRRAISAVHQEIYLFDGTLRANVAYGRQGATDGEILEALRQASALGVVESRPQGLDFEVGARGRKLSGGERQRVAIARALLKEAPILALDEATSSLDYATEAAIQRSVRQESTRRGVIIVAHRLASIRHADHIVVLERGKVREQGKHTKLVKAGGLYAALWKLQSGESPFGAELELRLARP